MDRKELARQLRAEADQLIAAATVLEGGVVRAPRGSKVAAKKVGRKPGAKKSKTGKRLGRPPKVPAE